jgi:hypothetical protein
MYAIVWALIYYPRSPIWGLGMAFNLGKIETVVLFTPPFSEGITLEPFEMNYFWGSEVWHTPMTLGSNFSIGNGSRSFRGNTVILW